MNTSTNLVRRGLFGAFATCALGGVAAATVALPTAGAAPGNCTAAGLASTASGVMNAAGGYLGSHSGLNDVLTSAASQAPGDGATSVRNYFTGHPNEYNDMRGIVRPLTDLRSQCGMSVTPAQLGTLFEALSQ